MCMKLVDFTVIRKKTISEILCFCMSGWKTCFIIHHIRHFDGLHVVIPIADLYFNAALKATKIVVSKVHGTPSYGGCGAIC
jgi:hypothetical protein